MPILLRCHNCGQRLQVDDAFAGSLCRCVHCGALSEVPAVSGTDESDRPARPAAPMQRAPSPGAAPPHPPAQPTPPAPAGQRPSAPGRPTAPSPPQTRPGALPTPPPGTTAERFADGRVIAQAAVARDSAKTRGIIALAAIAVALVLVFAVVFIVTSEAKRSTDLADQTSASPTPTPQSPFISGAEPFPRPAQPGATPGTRTTPRPPGPPGPTAPLPTINLPTPTPIPQVAGPRFAGLPVKEGPVAYLLDASSATPRGTLGLLGEVVAQSTTTLDKQTPYNVMLTRGSFPPRKLFQTNTTPATDYSDLIIGQIDDFTPEGTSAVATDVLRLAKEGFKTVTIGLARVQGDTRALESTRKELDELNVRVVVLIVLPSRATKPDLATIAWAKLVKDPATDLVVLTEDDVNRLLGR